MRRRVHVRPVVLEHPEATCEVSVLFRCGVHFRLERAIVSRPRRQLIVDRVGHVDDTRLAARDSIQKVGRGRVSLLRSAQQHCTSRDNRASHEDASSHIGSPCYELCLFEVVSLSAQGKGMPGDATMPAMRRSSEYSSSVSGQIVSRVFFRNLIFRSRRFSRISASVTCRGSRSIARKSTTSRFASEWWGSGYGSRLTSASA